MRDIPSEIKITGSRPQASNIMATATGSITGTAPLGGISGIGTWEMLEMLFGMVVIMIYKIQFLYKKHIFMRVYIDINKFISLMRDLRKAKFIVRVLITFTVIAFGMVIFFVSNDTTTQYFGAAMVTNAWMIWMSAGKANTVETPTTAGPVNLPADIENPPDDIMLEVSDSHSHHE